MMGLFGGIKNSYKKSEAAVIVQNLLEHHNKMGLFNLDPAMTATKLVGAVWDDKPDIFEGKFGQRPHKLTVAASALAYGVGLFSEDDMNRSSLGIALGTILSDVEKNGSFYPFNSMDITLLEVSAKVFEAMASNVDGDSLHDDF